MAVSKIIKQSTSCFLPEELVLKILTYLPVSSLLRCKSVCKTWLSIISNPQFTQAHLIQSRKKQPSYLLNVIHESIYIDTCEDSTLLCELDFFDGLIDVVCSCNGLVCIGGLYTHVIYLGNPMTKRFKRLPTPSEQYVCDQFLLGFGFDDISNDYKILRISVVPQAEYEYDGVSVIYALEAEMYSANDDSWKHVHVPETLKYFRILRSVCLHLKGSRFLYFEGIHDLLSFDLHDEVFRVHRYPIPPLPLQQRKSFVLDFEGSVAMIFTESANDGLVHSLWTLNDVLGNWSWTKEFNLDESVNKVGVIGLYLGHGQFFARRGGGIFYDYKKKQVKIFIDQAPPARNLAEFNETLVSLKGFEQLEESGSSL